MSLSIQDELIDLLLHLTAQKQEMNSMKSGGLNRSQSISIDLHRSPSILFDFIRSHSISFDLIRFHSMSIDII